MRIRAGLAIAALLAAALSALGAAPAQACTCGAAIGAGGAITAPETRAVVQWNDGIETLDLTVTTRGATGTVGLIIPTPKRATVTAGDPALFTMVDRAIRPREIVEDDWWGRGSDPEPQQSPAPASDASLTSTRARASDTAAVTKWATKAGLKLDAATTTALAGYSRIGWSFSLITLTARAGELAPVRLTFASTQRVYPLAFSAASENPVSLRLYVAGDHRADVAQLTRAHDPLDAAIAVAWAGPTAGGPAAKLARYLTVIDLHLDDPALQATTDLRVVDAVSDDTVVPERLVERPIRLIGLPLGWLLVIWGAIGATIGLAAIALRLRAR